MEMDLKTVKNVNRVFYEVEAGEYDIRHPEIMSGDRSWWESFGKILIKTLNGRKPLTVLDIGSGTGFVVETLQNNLSGDHIICYDLSIEMLKCSKEKFGMKDINYLVGDAESIPFGDSSFDAVTFNSVLHHVPDYHVFLKEVNRVLKDGGCLAFAHEPNKSFFNSIFLRIVASVYKLAGFGMEITDSMQEKINDKLRDNGVIEEGLSKEEIIKMVDFHSPVEQSSIGIDKDKGFVPSEMISNNLASFEILELREYTTYFHRPFLERNVWIRKLIEGGVRLFGGRGNLFSLIARKKGINENN